MDIRQHHIIMALVAIILLILLIKPQIVSMIAILIIMGIVPGTEYVVPSLACLIFFIVASLITLRWFFTRPPYHPAPVVMPEMTKAETTRATVRSRATAKQTVARKTAATTTRRYRKQTAKV